MQQVLTPIAGSAKFMIPRRTSYPWFLMPLRAVGQT